MTIGFLSMLIVRHLANQNIRFFVTTKFAETLSFWKLLLNNGGVVWKPSLGPTFGLQVVPNTFQPNPWGHLLVNSMASTCFLFSRMVHHLDLQTKWVQPLAFSWTTGLTKIHVLTCLKSKMSMNWISYLCVSSLMQVAMQSHEYKPKCFALLLGIECSLHPLPLKHFPPPLHWSGTS